MWSQLLWWLCWVRFLRELADNNIHAQTDITNAVNAPILASIPKSFTVAGHVPAVIVKPRGHAAEEFRRLCTNLSFVENGNEDRPDNDHSNVIIVTSAVPGEGKTSVSVNLAAYMQRRVRAYCSLMRMLVTPLWRRRWA